jgi:hypothetical protein
MEDTPYRVKLQCVQAVTNIVSIQLLRVHGTALRTSHIPIDAVTVGRCTIKSFDRRVFPL